MKRLHAGPLGQVGQEGGSGGVEDEVLAGGKLGHGVVGKAGQEDHLVEAAHVVELEVEDVLVHDAHFLGQVIAEPEEIDDADLISSLEQLGNEHGTDVAGAAGDEYLHSGSPFRAGR